MTVTRLLIFVLPVAACAYDPPVKGDRQSAAFQANLASCRDTGGKAAYHDVISRGPLFMTYPISLPLLKRSETRKCMVGKGYQLENG